MIPEEENVFTKYKKGNWYMPEIKEEWEQEDPIRTKKKEKIVKILKKTAWIVGIIAFIALGVVVLSDYFVQG